MTYENWDSILDELIADTENNTLTYIGGDCHLSETKEHIINETRFAVIQNFKCKCGTRIEWGVCIRGTPLLRLHKE